MGCGPLPNWLRNNRCIYAIDKFDDNLCVWSCLAIYNRKDIQKGTEVVTRTALSLAREYYSDKNLKKRDVKPTKLVDFEGIAKRHNVIVMFYEPKKDKGKNAGSVWRLVYGKLQHKSDLPTINLGLWGVIVFTLRRWMCFVINGLLADIYTKRKFGILRHLKDEKCKEEKQESPVQEVNLSTF